MKTICCFVSCFPRCSKGPAEIDFEAEGNAKLAVKLNIDPSNSNKYEHMDMIWKHPDGKGAIYVGDVHAASNLKLLRKSGICWVVNCTRPILAGRGELANFFIDQKADICYHDVGVRHKLFDLSCICIY